MKYIIILGDGMSDEPIAALGGRTPLQQANTPCMDYLAQKGKMGLFSTIPEGMAPGSEVANLAVLGYDPRVDLEGRGSLEAASMNIPIEEDEMAMRCNLICIEECKIKNHSAGHISTEEARELMLYLDEHLGTEVVKFFPGISYRHLLKIKGGDKHLRCTPPHDVPGTPFQEVLIQSENEEAKPTAQLLNDLILASQKLLEEHPINKKRKEAGKDAANSIWPWSPGYKPKMKTLAEIYPIQSGSVISAVDLIKGIGVYAGLDNVDVPGATGLYDTDYEGKTQAALDALKQQDFVFLHIEASDEAGHEGDVDLKIKTIEYLDNRVLKTIIEQVEAWDEPVTIALLPDHPTPCRLKTHTCDPVPFLIYRTNQPEEHPGRTYDEASAQSGEYGLLRGDEFMKALFNIE